MKEVGDNTLKFNTYTWGIIRSLNEHGKQSFNLLTHLIKGHIGCYYKIFCRFINDLIEYDKDNPSLVLTLEILIVRAANKYEIYIQNNTWMKLDDIDKELMALRAEVHKKNNELAKHAVSKTS